MQKEEPCPPLCVTKGKTTRCLQSYATLDAPVGTVWTFQDNAWMNNVIGMEWFREVFLKNCGPQRPQLLILDSHGSHEVVELLELAREENIHVLALPPHATHMLQPLDRVVFAPFKKSYRRFCTEFMTEHPGHVINKTTWPRLLTSTWNSVMTPGLLKKAFEATGIHPCNRNAIPKTAFAPSLALDRSAPLTYADNDIEEEMIEREDDIQEAVDDEDLGKEVAAPGGDGQEHLLETEHEQEVETHDITMDSVSFLDGQGCTKRRKGKKGKGEAAKEREEESKAVDAPMNKCCIFQVAFTYVQFFS